MQPIVGGSVEPGAQIYSDEHGEQWKMDDYTHSIVNHLAQYVDGNVHTNGMENFWSLLKRTLGGTYVSVEAFHLFRYIASGVTSKPASWGHFKTGQLSASRTAIVLPYR
jgi:hypothetical protein